MQITAAETRAKPGQQISRLTFLRKHITRVLSRPILYPSPFSSFLSVEPPTLITWKCSKRIEHCPGLFDSDPRVFERRTDTDSLRNLFGFRKLSLFPVDISFENCIAPAKSFTNTNCREFDDRGVRELCTRNVDYRIIE